MPSIFITGASSGAEHILPGLPIIGHKVEEAEELLRNWARAILA